MRRCDHCSHRDIFSLCRCGQNGDDLEKLNVTLIEAISTAEAKLIMLGGHVNRRKCQRPRDPTVLKVRLGMFEYDLWNQSDTSSPCMFPEASFRVREFHSLWYCTNRIGKGQGQYDIFFLRQGIYVGCSAHPYPVCVQRMELEGVGLVTKNWRVDCRSRW